ncbi:MAG: ribosome biogenesis GTPase Der [Simkania sp.]|nr:ribosome biogenesis GTPase Der [Simkania sp.]
MNQLKLAIVGRPNVGKSSLFNRLCKKRIAIVDEAEGITRDRLYADAEFFGRPFQVIDTGGIDPKSDIPFQEEIFRQAEIAIEEADVVVMVVDGMIGPTALDTQVAKILLRTGKPVTLAVNKIDDWGKSELVSDFYGLGIGRVVGVSAAQGLYLAELLEAAFEGAEWPEIEAQEEAGIKVAIVGRPNVGKSTLLNSILGEERCVVSPIPGTTRDSIDVPISVDGQSYTLIDTAGIRRKKAEHEVVDKFAAVRTERAISRADICLLVVDAQEGITAQEKKIAREIEEAGKGCIILLNKWDLVKGFRMEHCLKALQDDADFLKYCPTIFLSALTGRNLDKLFSAIDKVFAERQRRVTTGQLNKFVEKALQKYHPPMIQGRRLRIYYLAQVDINPPKFILFVNKPELMTETYKQYLINQFREEYGFNGAPLQFFLKGRQQKEGRSTSRPDIEPAVVEEEFEEEFEDEFFMEEDPI